MMDNGADADLAAITQNIDEADVICVYFPMLGKTLLIDNRCSQHAEPMIRVVPMAEDAHDRLRSLRRLRPELPRPGSLTFIPWHRRIDSLLQLGVWEHVLRRIDAYDEARHYRAVAACCLAELRDLERREVADAIAGPEYRTLWPRVSPA
jgi:hypothetical protein